MVDDNRCFLPWLVGALVVGSGLVVSATLVGQPTPNVESAQEMRKKLRKLQQSIDASAEIAAAQQAAKEARRSSKDSLDRNIVYETVDLDSTELETARNCVHPPDERRASYSIAIVAYGDGSTPSLPSMPGADHGELKPDSYLEMMAEHAPPPRQEGRPGIRMIFDLGPGDWHFALGDGWGVREEAREAIESRRGAVTLTLDKNHVGDAVCEIVGEVENLLEEAGETSLETFFKRREYRTRIRDLEARVEDAAPAEVDGIPPSSTYLEGRKSRLRRRLKQARSSISAGRLEAAGETLGEAERKVETLEERFDTLRTHADRARRAPDRVASTRKRLGMRLVWPLPGSDRLNDQLSNCRDHADTYREALAQGETLDRLAFHDGAFEKCLDELEITADETATKFTVVVTGVPALVFFGLIGVGIWRWRNRGLDVDSSDLDDPSVEAPESNADLSTDTDDRDLRQLADETSPEGSESERTPEPWRESIRRLSDRLDALEDAHPDVLSDDSSDAPPAALEDEDIERIDLAFALRERAEELLDEADTTSEPLEDDIRLGPENTRGATRLGRGLSREYEFSVREIPNELEDLIVEAEERLDKTDLPSGHW